METSKAILSELAAAIDGEIGRLPVTQDLYPEESLRTAAEKFAEFCEIAIEQTAGGGAAILSIRARDEYRRESRQIVGSFLSFLLDHVGGNRLRPEAEK
jgi:hypothetical protein